MGINKMILVLVISGSLIPLELPPYIFSEAIAAESSNTIPTNTTAPVINTAAPVGVFTVNVAAAAAAVATQNVINGILGTASVTPPFSSNPTPPPAPPALPAAPIPPPVPSLTNMPPAPPAPPPPTGPLTTTAYYDVNGNLIPTTGPVIWQLGMGDPLPPIPGPVTPIVTPTPPGPPPLITFDPATGNVTLGPPPLTAPTLNLTIFDVLGIPPPAPPTLPTVPTIFDVLGIPPPTPPRLVVPVLVAPLPPSDTMPPPLVVMGDDED